MSRRAFRSVSQRLSPTISIFSLAIAAALCAPAWSATPASPDPGPTLSVSTVTTAAPAAAPLVQPLAAPVAAPALVPMPPAATAPAPTAPVASAPAPAPAPMDVGAITQPFVAAITGDKVYVRSGPDTKYYEVGQLYKSDLVYVIGVNRGWYQILPPNGSFCMVAKEYVDLDAGGAAGTIKGDFINVRAGSAIYKESDPYAVVAPPLRKGTRLKVLGSTDKFYQIAPPEKAYFFISAQYVKAAAGAEYKVAQLKLPAGVTGPAGITVAPPTSVPALAAVITDPPAGAGAAGSGASTAGAGAPATLVPEVAPKVTYSATALAKFNETNGKYQAEAKKPLLEQNVEPILQDFKDILTMDNVAPSVKAGSEANIEAINRTLVVQRLSRDQAAAAAQLKTESAARQAAFEDAQRAKAEALATGPLTAQGLLKTSTVVAGMYALVNPQDQRVVAYVDPAAASIDVGMFVGKYIGVRGVTRKLDGSDITVIQVDNATMLPQPK